MPKVEAAQAEKTLLVERTELLDFLGENGYLNLRVLENGTVVGTFDLMFTRAVCVGLNWDSWEARYCYQDIALATRAVNEMVSDDEPPLPGYIATRGNAKSKGSGA